MAKKAETSSGAAKKKAAVKKAPAKKAASKKAATKKAAAKAPAGQSLASEVTFQLKAASAEWVSVVGTFNKWDADKGGMKRGGNGVWTKTLKLKPGAYEYKFLVDGEWWADPENPDFCYNEHGTTNSILCVDK